MKTKKKALPFDDGFRYLEISRNHGKMNALAFF